MSFFSGPNVWVSNGRYGVTRGVFKRLWAPNTQLSVVIVPTLNPGDDSGGGGDGQDMLLAETGEEILSEAGEELLVG